MTPVCLYVLWHPDYKPGRQLARSIYDWFHAPSQELHRAGLGLPVYYRSDPLDPLHGRVVGETKKCDFCKVLHGELAEGLLTEGLNQSHVRKSKRPPPPICLCDAQVNIIVPLVDKTMVADSVWRSYLGSLAEVASPQESGQESLETNAPNNQTDATSVEFNPSQAVMYPVSLHPSAFRLPPPIQLVNFLRVESNTDEDTDALETSLRRQLTEVTSRYLFANLARQQFSTRQPVASEGMNGQDMGAPLKIFLSHAKKDGQPMAEALRDRIVSYGQTQSFYDENDLAIGGLFAQALINAAEGGDTTAMLCIVTDAYASRPWCRAEISLARRPREDNRTSTGEESNPCWSVQPVVAVDALDSERTQGVPELGSATVIRWRVGAEDQILDTIMLETLLCANHRLQARSIIFQPGRHVITWIPDLSTLVKLRALISQSGRCLKEIVYPGHDLTENELQEYQALLGKNIKLLTFEQANLES